MKRIRRNARLVTGALATLCVLVAMGATLQLPAGATVGPAKVPDGSAARTARPATGTAAWRAAIKELRVPGPGCFRASYPAIRWQAVRCHAAPRVPFGPAHSPVAFTVGDGYDYSAQVSGLISQVNGSFYDVSPGITETGTDYRTGTIQPNTYSLQLNASPFSLIPLAGSTNTMCSGAASASACQGWQQFIFDSVADAVYIQYWLLNYGTGHTTCPAGWGQFDQSYSQGQVVETCWTNSQESPLATGTPPVRVPAPTVAQLGSVTLTGTATGTGDSVKIATGSGAAAMSAPSVLNLAQSWTTAEWGVFGDGNGTEATFSAGTILRTTMGISDGTTAAPTCLLEGFTGETNNLDLDGYETNFVGPPASPNFGIQETNNPGTPAASCASGRGWGGGDLVASIGTSPSTVVQAGTAIDFSSTSTDYPGGEIVSYTWTWKPNGGTAVQFGNGNPRSSLLFIPRYPNSVTGTVTLTVTDDLGQSASASTTVMWAPKCPLSICRAP